MIRLIKNTWNICLNISASVGICNPGGYFHCEMAVLLKYLVILCVLFFFFLLHCLLCQAVHMGKGRPPVNSGDSG